MGMSFKDIWYSNYATTPTLLTIHIYGFLQTAQQYNNKCALISQMEAKKKQKGKMKQVNAGIKRGKSTDLNRDNYT